MKVFLTALAIAASASLVLAADEEKKVPSFPGAEGFGALATGGRGGTVYRVTNLDDDGPGSFRDACSKSGRIVIFDVSGVIRVKKQVVIESNITVAGQTAPGGGITLYGGGISMSERQNVIVRYLRLRSGIESPRGGKSLNISSGSNIIVDHCSISWGRWDNIGFTGNAKDITLQDCIVSEAIDPQKFGALIDSSSNITVARNLWINNNNRNPKGKAHMQYINNVVYNWGSGGYAGGHSAADWNQDLIGNYFIKGPSSNERFAGGFSDTDKLYLHDNLIDADCDGKLSGQPVAEKDFRSQNDKPPTFQPAAFNTPPVAVKVLSPAEAYEHILAKAGASLHRDSIDQRQIDQLKSLGTEGKVIPNEAAVGGISEIATAPALADGDADGIPDAWERERKLDPTNADDAKQIDPTTGYSHLEGYINSLAK